MRWPRLLSGLAIAAALLGITPGSVAVSGAQAQSWQPDAEEQWLFELRTQRYRIGEGIRGYARGNQVCVNFADVVQALDLPIRINGELRRATGWAFDERRTLLVDRESGRAAIASASDPIGAGDITDTPEGWCVAPAALSRWLGVEFTADTANSVLHLRTETPMPFEQAAERRQRAASVRPDQDFSLADMPRATRDYAMWETPSVDVVASVGYVRDAAAGTSQLRRRYEFFASGELLGASFEARLASDDRGIPRSLRTRLYRSDPDGGLFGPLGATHAAIGDVSGMATPLAAQPVTGRGAIVTNRPLDLPDGFDRITFRGDLPAGWDAELYRNGQLLGFAEQGSDGRYEFRDVRLLYGINRFEIVLYGPQGQVRREVRNIPVGIDAIPPGKTYYWAGILQDDHDLIDLFGDEPRPFRRGWRYLIGVEHGLNRRTTLGAWLSSILIENTRYTTGEVSVRRSIGGLIVEATGSGQSGGGTAGRIAAVTMLGSGSLQLESIRAWGGFRSDRVTAGLSGLHSLSFDHSLRLGGTVLPVHVEATVRQRTDGNDRLTLGTRISGNWRNISVTGQVDWSRSIASPTGPGEPSQVTLGLLANARFGRLRLRGELRTAIVGPTDNDQASITAEWSQSERTDWRVELGYQGGNRRARLGVGYTRRFDRFALGALAEVASDGSVAGSLNLAFAFGPDPRDGGLRVTRERIAAQGQALARVFYDDNADGRRQPGEQLAEGVVVTAGNALAEVPTGNDGETIVDSLTPFRAVLIGIDESSLPDPLVRPALRGVVVVPRPGVATPVDLPLVSAGEIDGTLMREGGNGIEGVDLELVDASGVVRARARSDYDGFFIFESVPYGRYSLRVSALAAQALSVEAMLAPVTLSRADSRASLGGLIVRARATLARGPPQPPADPADDAARGAGQP